MKTYIEQGIGAVDSPYKDKDKAEKRSWSLVEKLLLGLTAGQYLRQALRNPFNWILGLIFIVGLPLIAGRFWFGLSFATHSSNDYP